MENPVFVLIVTSILVWCSVLL